MKFEDIEVGTFLYRADDEEFYTVYLVKRVFIREFNREVHCIRISNKKDGGYTIVVDFSMITNEFENKILLVLEELKGIKKTRFLEWLFEWIFKGMLIMNKIKR